MAKKKSRAKTRQRVSRNRGSASGQPNPADVAIEECGFIVDDDGVIREFLGHTAPLLGFAPGSATLDIRGVVRSDLVAPLSEAFDRAREANEAAHATGSVVRIHGKAVRVDFTVSPVSRRPNAWKIIAHCEAPAGHGSHDPEHPVTEPPIARIRRLQDDLRHLRDEENRRQDALISELEDALVGVREVQEELEISNAELEASNVQLTAAIAERERVQEQLARSEAAAREVLETASQGILSVDFSGKIVRANEMAHTMFGYESGDLVGRQVGALVPRGLRRAHARHMTGFFQSPERRPMGVGRDLWGQRRDGSRFPVEVGLSSITGKEGPLAIAFISDITERKNNEQEVLENREQLRGLTNRLITAAEDETRKWARELHDVYTQRLVAIAMEIDRIVRPREGGPDAEIVGGLRTIESRVRTLSDEVHRMSRRMHPAILDDLGLVAALRSELGAFQKQHGIAAGLRAEGVRGDLPSDIALCCYRIVQEALNNVRKHAGTDRVSVDLSETDGVLTLVLRDEGRGFDPGGLSDRGLGLLSMGERAQAVGGTVSIESDRGKGTTVRVRVPVGAAG